MQGDQYEWDQLLTAQEVASLARVHVESFHRWCRQGLGPTATRIGKVARYAESDVRRWIASRQTEREDVA